MNPKNTPPFKIEAAKCPKVLLIVLDGFGEGKDYPFNAIKNAKMPFYKELCLKFPKSRLLTSGEAVGLPDGVMGNSEVGHMNMGAGRIVYQELSRINRDIKNGEFFLNLVLLKNIAVNTALRHVKMTFPAKHLAFYPGRHDRHADKLRMRVLQTCAGTRPAVFKNQNVPNPFILS